MLNTKSILEMGNGAFQERVDYEMAKVINNIMDANTKATQKRRLTVTIDFLPDDDRTGINVDVSVKSTLAPTTPARTSLYVAGDTDSGEMQVVEMVPQIPGQFGLNGADQEAPATLKLVNFN